MHSFGFYLAFLLIERNLYCMVGSHTKIPFLAGVKMKVGGGVEVVVGLFPPSSFLFLAPFTFGIIVIREREEEARGDSELEGGGGGGNGDFSFPVYYNNFCGQTHPTQVAT